MVWLRTYACFGVRHLEAQIPTLPLTYLLYGRDKLLNLPDSFSFVKMD